MRLPPQLIVPMLILLVLGVAALFYEPELVTVIGMVVYLLHIPYAVWKYNHLKNHPELWRTARACDPVGPAAGSGCGSRAGSGSPGDCRTGRRPRTSEGPGPGGDRGAPGAANRDRSSHRL